MPENETALTFNEDKRKVAAYDAARSHVKITGNTRAVYVLRIQALEKAINAYFMAKYDHSWGPSKDWHKRHDTQKREAELMALLGKEQEDYHSD
jgi:hypothetical protein